MNKIFLLLIPLVLSSFIHLWNPVGYPDIFFDEGIYMRRAINLLNTGNPQEEFLYDHPYFGQIVIASVLTITNYPDLKTSIDLETLQSAYLIPRILMGVLAVLDTFLIYKIVQIRYSVNAAFLSASLFAVLPFTWIFRRILLDSIAVPLILAAILFAIYSAKSKQKRALIFISGCLLGLAVFTKIPAFTMIFVVAWIIYADRKKLSDLLLLLIPFVLIPLIWPTNAIMLDQFHLWQKDVLWQTQRTNDIWGILGFFAASDPVMFVLGLSGIIFAAVRRDKLLLVWFIPFVVFLSIVGYKQYFHWMIVIPVMCIAAGILLESILNFKIIKKNIGIGIISSIIIFGFISTTLLILNDISYNQFQALSYVLKNYDESFTIVASPVYSWILDDIFKRENILKDYSYVLFYPFNSEKTVIIVDEHYRIDLTRGPQLQNLVDRTTVVKTFESRISGFDTGIYPYNSIYANGEARQIEIREDILRE